MKNYFEIKPNEGIGDFLFGETAEEVLSFFGEPDETEDLTEEDEKVRIVSFWDKGFTFFFEGPDYSYFSCVESDNEELKLFGEKIIGKTSKELLSLLKTNGFTEYEAEDEEWGEKRISFEELSIDFYFEDDELISISWAEPFYEDEEED
ncbi:MAG: hypothetical protein PHT69_07295 [Bacteroidales bacterium]|nr:hypothetical protein [Bacteroidales bacterium]